MGIQSVHGEGERKQYIYTYIKFLREMSLKKKVCEIKCFGEGRESLSIYPCTDFISMWP